MFLMTLHVPLTSRVNCSCMQLFDYSYDTPEENLACDEALLMECENGNSDEVLRFWESPRPFVVLGYTGKIDAETNRAACAELGVPVLRRSSGGGTVVQGPGCLNYSLIARVPEGQALTGITQTNCQVMQAQARALAGVLDWPVKIRGYTDLAVIHPARGELKISGNAQRRKRNFFLFHGTFLLNFDLSLIPRLLKEPEVQPDYRAKRNHLDFVTNIEVDAQIVKDSLAREWQATQTLAIDPASHIETLIHEKYGRSQWNEKF